MMSEGFCLECSLKLTQINMIARCHGFNIHYIMTYLSATNIHLVRLLLLIKSADIFYYTYVDYRQC